MFYTCIKCFIQVFYTCIPTPTRDNNRCWKFTKNIKITWYNTIVLLQNDESSTAENH